MDFWLIIFSALLTLLIGILIGYFASKLSIEAKMIQAKTSASHILEEANRQVETNKKEAILETKEEIQKMKEKASSEFEEKKRDLQNFEQRIIGREENVDRRILSLEKREVSLEKKDAELADIEEQIKEKESKAEALVGEQEMKLLEISRLDRHRAREIILERTEGELEYEISKYVKDAEEKAKLEAGKKAKNILVTAIQRFASEQTNEYSITTINLPSDEMKGRIIGREGRNIRTIEALTGVDVIVDETPESVVLSCFNPIRREIARLSLENLIADGRIHPAKIEEMVERVTQEIEEKMLEVAEHAIFDLGIGRMDKDLIRLLGHLHYRTSYGQNVLKHSMEVAYLAGMMAAEIGEDEQLARRAGLLHDIGKAVDHESEGSHVELGIEIGRRYKEHDVVIDAIASHHGDVPAESLIAMLVAAADSLSAARPGARSESLENYMKRLEKLEEIAHEFHGVSKVFAIQAGREIRIAVLPNKVDDAKAHKLARDVRKRIENELNYPGNIKVTVIRETRVIEIAK